MVIKRKVVLLKTTNKSRLIIRTFIGFFVLFFIFFFWMAKGSAQEGKTEIPEKKSKYFDLRDSIKKALVTEKENVGQLETDLRLAESLNKAMKTEYNAYNIQLSAHGNLLLLPQTTIEDLEKARVTHRATLDSIARHLKELAQKLDTINQLRHQTEEQYVLNKKQLAEIKIEDSKEPETGPLIENLQILIKSLSTKKELIKKLHIIYSEQLGELEEIQKAFTELSKKFNQEIQKRRKQELFERKASPLVALDWKQIQAELQLLGGQIMLLSAGDFWIDQARILWQSGGFLLFTSLLLFGITQFLLFRFQRFCRHIIEQQPFYSRQPGLRITLKLLNRSLHLLGTTLFLYVYAKVRHIYSSVPVIQMTLYVLLIWLFCRWVMDFLNLWNQEKGPIIPEKIVRRISLLLITTRFFATFYVVIEWLIGSGSFILLMARIVFEVWLLAWSVPFWKIVQAELSQTPQKKSRLGSAAKFSLIGLGYVTAGGGFLLDLAGYGQLAIYWYTSWGRTAIVLLWGFLLYAILREWDKYLDEIPYPEQSDLTEGTHPLYWLLIRLCWMAWLGTLIVSILLAWGAKQTVIVGFFRILNYPIPVGEMRFSLLGFFYAFLILIFTHAATRIWRHILKEKILARSGLEWGLKDSITTITVYSLWTFGILISLHALGVSVTALAVAFGALGIGLGFGLQNIFNNFISGIILLFERPIQVGDALQINETWGIVKKINVRSTVVQTYDNASLIIPNSEFISTQVTNWSFKDMRLRRNITVGVAYGSDTEQVRQTLLEAAEKHPKVLKYPKPDVLFADFGDSALIFKLRAWTTVEYFLPVETDIRFEIDRLFRERNIEISFPQRDIHIRSVEKNTRFSVNSGDSTAPPPES
jgi:potassium efflux system protein